MPRRAGSNSRQCRNCKVWCAPAPWWEAAARPATPTGGATVRNVPVTPAATWAAGRYRAATAATPRERATCGTDSVRAASRLPSRPLAAAERAASLVAVRSGAAEHSIRPPLALARGLAHPADGHHDGYQDEQSGDAKQPGDGRGDGGGEPCVQGEEHR